MWKKSLGTLLPYFSQYKKEITWGLLALLVTDIAGMAIPWLLKVVIDALPDKPSTASLVKWSCLILFFALVQGLGRFGWRKFLFGPSRKVETDLMNRFFKHLTSLDQTFFQKNKIGDLISRGTNDLRSVRDFFGLGLLVVVDALLVIILCACLMVNLNPKLTFWALLPLPLISLLFLKFIRLTQEGHRKIQDNLGKITAKVQENLAGIRTLKAFVQEEKELEKFGKLNRAHVEKNLALAKLNGLFAPSLAFTIGLSALISLWMGSRDVIAGEMTLGDFVAFNGYLAMLSWPMMAIGFIINLSQKGISATARIDSVLTTQSALQSFEKVSSFKTMSGPLEFRDVKFSYPESHDDALRNINLKIEAGSHAAILGPVGSGKSTLLKMVLRIHDPKSGQVFVKGEDLRQIPLSNLRQSIGFLEQEPFIFSTSLRANLLMGDPDADDQRIHEFLYKAGFDEDLKGMPEGLDTVIGERGFNLSGGQKQRLALARVLIRNPKILVLDDAFSSIDVETESLILERITDEIKNITLIWATHRLSIVPRMDIFVVMDQGEIREMGTHERLLKEGNWYSRVYAYHEETRKIEASLE